MTNKQKQDKEIDERFLSFCEEELRKAQERLKEAEAELDTAQYARKYWADQVLENGGELEGSVRWMQWVWEEKQ